MLCQNLKKEEWSCDLLLVGGLCYILKTGNMHFCLCDLLVALFISGFFELGSPNRGDSLDRNINEEKRVTKDFLILVSLLVFIFV